MLVVLAACSGTGETIGNDSTVQPDVPADRAGDDVRIPGELVQKDESEPDDAFAPDFGPVDTPTFDEQSCQPGTGCHLEPCLEPADCQSGICLLHMGELVCSDTCVEECPAGFECKTSTLFGPDLTYVCMSLHPGLCLPCEANKDCEGIAGLGSACIAYGADGYYCGDQCDEAGDCPAGYGCEQSATVDGLLVSQCVAAAGCDCSAYAVSQALSTACFAENEHGICDGVRTCTPAGLSECTASIPGEELCDGLDNDCNGLVDDIGCDDGNPCTQDECLGEAGCSNEPISGGECLDGDACTIGDHCDGGVCLGAPLNCDDLNPCTSDTCDSKFGCKYEFTNDPCNDGNPCTYGDTCLAGTCTGLPGFCQCESDGDCVEASREISAWANGIATSRQLPMSVCRSRAVKSSATSPKGRIPTAISTSATRAPDSAWRCPRTREANVTTMMSVPLWTSASMVSVCQGPW